MEADARQWLEKKVEAFLRRIGLREGQTVLDFGCNNGNYTMPAARIVGDSGRLYALDKNEDSLKGLMREVEKKRLRNIETLHVAEDRHIPLPRHSVDVALLYDTLHCGYMPDVAQRKRVLARIYSVIRPGGILSCYPTHLRKYGMTFKKLLKEIVDVGFRLEDEHRRVVIHDGKLVRGRVFSFKKPSFCHSLPVERKK